jgi:hydrogenase expression/formation protein HypC
MCLSIPGKIIAIKGEFASVDYGDHGVRENVNLSLVKGEVGSYVLVQGGFAIKVLSADEAQEVLDMLKFIEGQFSSATGTS